MNIAALIKAILIIQDRQVEKAEQGLAPGTDTWKGTPEVAETAIVGTIDGVVNQGLYSVLMGNDAKTVAKDAIKGGITGALAGGFGYGVSRAAENMRTSGIIKENVSSIGENGVNELFLPDEFYQKNLPK